MRGCTASSCGKRHERVGDVRWLHKPPTFPRRSPRLSFAHRCGCLPSACCVAPRRQSSRTPSQLYAAVTQSYQDGDLESAKRKLQLALQIDKDVRPSSEMLKQIGLAPQQAKSGGSTGSAPVSIKTLARMIFPVEFKDTSLQSALEYI